MNQETRKTGHDAESEPHLEEVVPPTWGPASWWRLGVAALAVLILAVLVFQIL